MVRSVQKRINPFVPDALFLYPLMFSGGREKVHWEQMGEEPYQTFMMEPFSKIPSVENETFIRKWLTFLLP